MRRLATWMIVGGLLASTLSGNAWRLGFPLAPDRVLLPAGILLLAVDGGLRAAGPFRWRWVHTLALTTLVWAAWSAQAVGTLTTSYGAYALLDRLLVPFAAFALAPALFPSDRDREVLLKALVFLGGYLGATAVAEVLGPQSLVFPSYVVDPGAGILFGRARGPFVQPEANGLVMTTCLFAAGYALVALRGAWRVAAALALPACGVGILLTLTRSVWLGAVLAVLVVCWMLPQLRRRLPVLVLGGAACLVLVLVAVPSLGTTLVERITTERSLYDRQNTNAAALRIIEEEPLTGIGWVRFLEEGVDHVRQADTYPVTNVRIEVHNVVLARAAELGVPGAALWVGAVLAGPVLAARRGRAAARRDLSLAGWRYVLIGTGVCWGVCIMLSPVPYPLPNILLWLLGGIVATPWLVGARRHDAQLTDRDRPDGERALAGGSARAGGSLPPTGPAPDTTGPSW